MLCDELSLRLAEVADDSIPLSGPEADHVATCLRCQAELVHYRKLIRSLRALRAIPLDPQEDLLADVLEALRPLASVHRLHGRRNRRAAYLGGLAAAATAGAAGAVVLASRLATRPRLASWTPGSRAEPRLLAS